MVTRREWQRQADHYDSKANRFMEEGDHEMAEHYERKADACRANAVYGTEKEEE